MRDPEQISRRSFIGWGTAVSGSLTWAGALTSLSSCGGSDAMTESGADAAASAEKLPVISNPSRVAMSVQARQVQWVPGKSPTSANAWVYAADGVTPASGVLANHLGPIIDVRRGSPCTVTWSNQIPRSVAFPMLLADPPINTPPELAICGRIQLQSPVGVTTHLHGRIHLDLRRTASAACCRRMCAG